MSEHDSSDGTAAALGLAPSPVPAATAEEVELNATEVWLPLVQASFRPVGLHADAVRALIRLAQPVLLPKGVQLLMRGQLADRHWLLLSGRVAMGLAAQGRVSQQTREVTPGHWIDNASAWMGSDALYLEDAVVEQDALVWAFNQAEVVRCGVRHPQLLLAWASSLVGRVRGMLMAELSLMRQSTESRFAAWLLQNAEPPEPAEPAEPGEADDSQPAEPAPVGRVVLRQRKRALASQLGATPETFSRVLKQLVVRGAVKVRGYTIEITDMRMLRELAEQGR